MIGSSSIGTFDAEVTTGDHDRVAFLDDIIEDTHRVLIFNFRNDPRLAAMFRENAFESLDVRSLATKAQRDVVNADGGSKFNIGQVLFRKRRQVDFDPRKIDMASGTENTLREDLTPDAVVILGQDFHVDHAIVNEHDVSNRNIVNETLVVDID